MNTYKRAGVNISLAERFTRFLMKKSKFIGGFSGLYRVKGAADLYAAASTDGVGTKLKLAFILNRHDTVGIDLVAMCVNDIVTCGAKPAFFLDYYATGRLNLKISREIIKGVRKGCALADCDLIGGETAEMPGFYQKDEYDLAGFGVGFVEKGDIIDGSKIRTGDVLLGLKSSGFHSNGFSLIRSVLAKKGLLEKYAAKLLTPTKIYVKEIKKLRRQLKKRREDILGLAHITGGGIAGNLSRILPPRASAVVRKNSWKVPRVMREIQEIGNIPEKEMWKTFNMGIGMIAVIKRDSVETAVKILNDVVVIGEIKRGTGKVEIVGDMTDKRGGKHVSEIW